MGSSRSCGGTVTRRRRFGLAGATTSSGERPIYLPIEPCRLADTRPAPTTVGTRATPIGSAETETFIGWGSVGECDLAAGTSALSLNLTAVGATAPTFLQFFPAGTARPAEGSNLNPVPGRPPTPNAVNVTLSDAGEFNVDNLQGLVNVIIDVVGVFDDHDHDDSYIAEVVTTSAADDGPVFMPEGSHFSESFTTTMPGRLRISLSASVGVECTPSDATTRYLYLVVDDVPIEASISVPNNSGTANHTFVGTTTETIPAGDHNVELGSECFGSNTSGVTTVNTNAICEMTVLPS